MSMKHAQKNEEQEEEEGGRVVFSPPFNFIEIEFIEQIQTTVTYKQV